MSTGLRVLVLAACAFLVQCTSGEGAVPAFAPEDMIGTRLRAETVVYAMAITLDRGHERTVDEIVLVAPPGFSGPKVVEQLSLPKGTILRVMGVQESSTHPQAQQVYVVKRLDGTFPYEVPLVVGIDPALDGTSGVDPGLFAWVTPAR